MKDKPVLPMPNLLEVIKELQEFCKTEIIEWEVDQYCLRDSNTDDYRHYQRLEGRAHFAEEVLEKIELLMSTPVEIKKTEVIKLKEKINE
jgi:hypothetical protein